VSARSSRRKGADFERAVRRRLAAVFGERHVQRGQQVPGAAAVPDVVAPGLVIECKAGRRTAARPALRQAVDEARGRRGWPVAVCRNDRRGTTVTMRFEDFVALVRDWHELRIQAV